MRRSLATAVAALLLAAGAAPAQRPGEVAGRVVEAGSAAPVEMAGVELPELSLRVWTDAGGRFRLRGVETGRWRVRVTRAGFAPADAEVEVREAGEAWVELRLVPSVVVLEAVRVVGTADAVPGESALSRVEIEASGARTAAELVARVPGVVVRSASPGGAATASIRGSAAGEVLVLVDGVPLNDPVSGAADLSTVAAAAIERITILSGARSARYGPRAQAGVVRIETRAGEVRPSAAVLAGTLAERGMEAEGGTIRGGWALQGGARVRTLDGAFTHPRDPNDPRPVQRANADVAELGGFAAAAGGVAGGRLRARASAERLERGLPGTGHTPSLHARQELERGRASLTWRRVGARGALSALLAGTGQRVRFADPAPPFGHRYDDTARVRHLTLRVEGERTGTGRSLRGWGWGVEGGVQRVESGALAEEAPRLRRDLGAFAHLSAELAPSGRAVALSAEARLDRDGGTGRMYPTHALTAATELGPFRARVASRSAFTPPTLGDQFFRAGVGVRPNPELRAQRVPAEWEGALAWSGGAGGAALAAEATAYTGDVRGMVVWLPDFRFLWSPRNVDVTRAGGELRGSAELPAAGLAARGAWAVARITYADPDARGVQLAYRPRHSGSASLAWTGGGWRTEAGARYTGTRYPATAPVNALPGFWSTSFRLGRGWRLGGWTLDTALDVDRVLDERDALIAGFPEPGRRLRIDLRASRAPLSPGEP